MPDNVVLCIEHRRLSELRAVRVRATDTTAQLNYLCSCDVFPRHSLDGSKKEKVPKVLGDVSVGEVLDAHRGGELDLDLQNPYVERPDIIKHMLPQY